MIYLVIGVIVVLVVIYLFNSYQNKYQSLQGNVFNFIVGIVLIFLCASLIYVYTQAGADFSSPSGIFSFFKIYFGWVGSLGSKLTHVSGYAVNQDWSINSTG